MNTKNILMANLIGYVLLLAVFGAIGSTGYFGYLLITHGYVLADLLKLVGSIVALGVILVIRSTVSMAMFNKVSKDMMSNNSFDSDFFNQR